MEEAERVLSEVEAVAQAIWLGSEIMSTRPRQWVDIPEGVRGYWRSLARAAIIRLDQVRGK